jgi:DNA polymerase/3'-5' exonuclease PolX
MSQGPRIKLGDARRLCQDLWNIWGLDDTAVVVGSVRRGLPEVGDIELIVPVQEIRQRGDDQIDYLFNRINGSMSNPWVDPKAKERSMFDPEPLVIEPEPDQIIGEAVRGLKPGFLSASLLLRPLGLEVPCQLYRYTPQNRGWIELMRTGPADFGRLFLIAWKRRWNIPHEQQASIDGHLVNRDGEIVHVPDEHAAFSLCGMEFILPESRDSWVLEQVRLAARERREVMR